MTRAERVAAAVERHLAAAMRLAMAQAQAEVAKQEFLATLDALDGSISEAELLQELTEAAK